MKVLKKILAFIIIALMGLGIYAEYFAEKKTDSTENVVEQPSQVTVPKATVAHTPPEVMCGIFDNLQSDYVFTSDPWKQYGEIYTCGIDGMYFGKQKVDQSYKFNNSIFYTITSVQADQWDLVELIFSAYKPSEITSDHKNVYYQMVGILLDKLSSDSVSSGLLSKIRNDDSFEIVSNGYEISFRKDQHAKGGGHNYVLYISPAEINR